VIDSAPNLSIAYLLAAYRGGSLTPREVLARIRARAQACRDDNIWVRLLSEAETAPWLEALTGRDPAALPLYGIPFAIKDNIDLAGIPTTAGCAQFAYTPARSAFVVERLIAAGAVPVGKTNLDQFATGLTGTRSPWGAVRNVFDPRYIAGGSSSGSAVAVARGLASFALGTDTAGSGRVPAAFNNLVGIKPTRGLLGTSGVVPACRSLDCVSVFVLDCRDAATVMDVAAAVDPQDPYARAQRPGPDARERFRFGRPSDEQLEFFGDGASANLYHMALERLVRLGGVPVTIDLEPFLEAARLLYQGPWIAERYAAVGAFIETHGKAMLPVTRQIIAAGRAFSAVEAFTGLHRLQALRHTAARILRPVDFVVTPTAGTIYTIDAVNQDPVALNTRLGYYTNFMNLLDCAAVAVPAGFRADGLPFGVTLFAPAFHDAALLQYAARLHHAADLVLGASARPVPPPCAPSAGTDPEAVRLVVCGAHLQGLPLNAQLTERGARLVAATRTAPRYRLYALAGGPPQRPGLVRVAHGGAAIEVEVWELPLAELGGFVAGIPAPLGIGTVELAHGVWHKGFICEPCALENAVDITSFGGWRAWLARQEVLPE
jgi:allophanate hydrolase